MLYAFGFDAVGVVVGDLYFVDPKPERGQEGAEHGVRVEVRLLAREELHGSIYSAQPIVIDQPVWRADLLESVDGPAASFDRTHHHPRFVGWEPGGRTFDPGMAEDPIAFVGAQLSDVHALMDRARLDPTSVPPSDAEALRETVPEILDVTRRLLDRVRAGELARPPAEAAASTRLGWL
ncbi:MAG: hypothetical protein ACYDEN_13560 [Acidimicrobiales bacterium]